MKIKTIIIILFIIAITLLVFINNNSMKSNSINEYSSYSFENSLDDTFIEFKIDNVNCLDIVGDTTKLFDLISSNVLVYYYSDLHCSSCYENQLRIIQKYFHELEQKEVAVVIAKKEQLLMEKLLPLLYVI